METGKHDILKKVNDLETKHNTLKADVFQLLDDMKIIENKINIKLIEIDETEKKYVDLMAKLME